MLKALELSSILDKYYERIQEIKLSKCLDEFVNKLELFSDFLVVDEKNIT